MRLEEDAAGSGSFPVAGFGVGVEASGSAAIVFSSWILSLNSSETSRIPLNRISPFREFIARLSTGVS